MAKFVTYQVAVPIELGSELAQRLEKAAERSGLSVQQVVDIAVQLGIYGQISRNLALIEDSPANCGGGKN